MRDIKQIIKEEVQNFYEESNANFPSFGDHLNSISETGEGTAESYPYNHESISDNETNYFFTTEDGDDYVVYFIQKDWQKGIYEMEFGVEGGTPKTVVNKGRMYKVMATMLKIVNEFITNNKPNILRIEPSKTKGDNDMRRFDLYMQYIKKHIPPEYFVHEQAFYIIIERKIKR